MPPSGRREGNILSIANLIALFTFCRALSASEAALRSLPPSPTALESSSVKASISAWALAARSGSS